MRLLVLLQLGSPLGIPAMATALEISHVGWLAENVINPDLRGSDWVRKCQCPTRSSVESRSRYLYLAHPPPDSHSVCSTALRYRVLRPPRSRGMREHARRGKCDG